MHTYALIGSLHFQEAHISSFIKIHNIPSYHVIRLDNCKIGQVRLLQHTISLKLKEGAMRVIIITNPTIEAQNSLLKTVEEATTQNVMFFVSNTKDDLLPTILSRCQIVNLDKEKKEVDTELFDGIRKVLATSSDTFGITSLLPAVVELENIESVLLVLRSLIIKDITFAPVVLPVLRKLHTSYKLTKTNNVNKKMALEVSFLQI